MKSKSFTLKFVVVGSGDTSVGIRPTQQTVSVTFEDTEADEIDVECAKEMLRDTFRELLENGRTECFTEEEFEKKFPPVTYSIWRHYKNDTWKRMHVKSGLTKEEAQAHCRNPETSSRTCTSEEEVKHTALFGEWFDAWEAEE